MYLFFILKSLLKNVFKIKIPFLVKVPKSSCMFDLGVVGLSKYLTGGVSGFVVSKSFLLKFRLLDTCECDDSYKGKHVKTGSLQLQNIRSLEKKKSLFCRLQ